MREEDRDSDPSVESMGGVGSMASRMWHRRGGTSLYAKSKAFSHK